MKDTPLIVAHLLGGTSGLNLSTLTSDQEITDMVALAVRVAREIERQTEVNTPYPHPPWLRKEET